MGKTLAGIVLLVLMAQAVDGLVRAFAVPVPAPVVSLLLMVLFLHWQGRVPDFLDLGTSFLFRIFPLLFIPPLVALHHQTDVIAAFWPALLLIVSLSTAIGLVASAWLFRIFKSGWRQRR